MSDILVRGGKVVQPGGLRDADVRIAGGVIAEIAAGLTPIPGESVRDADGLVVLPGIIDCHTHFALDTGKMATRDDFLSGSVSAVAGGVTTVMNFAPQRPRQSLVDAVDAERRKADGRTVIDYGLHVCIGTPGHDWERELDTVAAGGVTSVKVHTTYRDTMFYTRDWDWYCLARACAQRDLLLMVHCENDDIVTGATDALLTNGQRAVRWHAAARPPVAEVEAVSRALAFCADTSCPTYLVHLTVPESVELARRARERGLPVLSEACAHHLTLDDSLYAAPDAARFVMVPPLRHEPERAGLARATLDGGIDALGSDHCGYSLDQRAASDFTVGSPGIPGVETLLRVAFTELSELGMPIGAIVHLMSARPAAIFGLPGKGQLSVGLDGDVVLFDPSHREILDEHTLHSRSGYSPWHGRELHGRVVATISRGTVLYDNGQVLGTPSHGRFVACERFSRQRAEEELQPTIAGVPT